MHGFRLTQEAKDEGFSGGSVNCNPLGHAFDVGEALSESDGGTFYTDNPALAEILRGYPSLEVVPDDDLPTDTTSIKLVDVPGADASAAPHTGPWQPQNPPEDEVPTPGEGEVVAEHADDPGTPGEAVEQGESVSGLATVGSSFGTAGLSESDTTHDEQD